MAKSRAQLKAEREARLSKSSSVVVKRAEGSASAGTSVKVDGVRQKTGVTETITATSKSRGTVTGTQATKQTSSVSQPRKETPRGMFGPEIPERTLTQRREQQNLISEAGRRARSENLPPTQDLGTTRSQEPAGQGPVMPANIKKSRDRLMVEQEKEAERIRAEVAREKFGNFGDFKTGQLTKDDLNEEAIIRAQARREKKVIESDLRNLTLGQKVTNPFSTASKFQEVLSLSAREARFKEGASTQSKVLAGVIEFGTGTLSSAYKNPAGLVALGAGVGFGSGLVVGRAVQVGLISARTARVGGAIVGGAFTAYAGGRIASSAIVAPKGQKVGVAAESTGKFVQFAAGAGLGSKAASSILSRSTQFTDYRLSEVARTQEVRVKPPRGKPVTSRTIKSSVEGEGLLQGVSAQTKGSTIIKTKGVGRDSVVTGLRGETTTTRGRFKVVESAKLKGGKQEVTIKQFRGKKLESVRVETRKLPDLSGKSRTGKPVIESELTTSGVLPQSVVKSTTSIKPTSSTVKGLKNGLAVTKSVKSRGSIKSTDVIEFTSPAIKTEVSTVTLRSNKDVGLFGIKYNQRVRQARAGKVSGEAIETVIDVRGKPKARVLVGGFEGATGDISGFRAGKFRQTTKSVGVRVTEVSVRTRPQTFGEKINVKFAKAFISSKRGDILLTGVDSATRSRGEVFGRAGSGSSFNEIISVGGKGVGGVGGVGSRIKVPGASVVSPVVPVVAAFAPIVRGRSVSRVAPRPSSVSEPKSEPKSEVKSLVEPVVDSVVSPVSQVREDTSFKSVTTPKSSVSTSSSSFSVVSPVLPLITGGASLPLIPSGFQEEKGKKKRKKGTQQKLYSPSLVALTKRSTKASRAVGKLTGISIRGGRI